MITIDKMQRDCLYPPRYMGLGCIKLNLKDGTLYNFYNVERTDAFSDHIHNHQFTFDSEIMRGGLRNNIYRIDDVPEGSDFKLVMGACTKGIEWDLIRDNVVATQTGYFDTLCGDVYHMDVDTFHKIEWLGDKVISRIHNIIWKRKEAQFIHSKSNPPICAFSRPKDQFECWEIIEDTMS